jgi:malonyl-CoA decarboxylase
MDRMADRVSPLVDSQPASKNPDRARAAVFYSINNCQPGLRGVSLGNFLIKNVVELLSAEFPRLKLFCTLSPVPGFSAWVDSLLKGGDDHPSKGLAAASKAMTAGLGAQTATIAGNIEQAVLRLEPLKETLMQLCATYLLHHGAGADPGRDPVARFHLNNGARLERINWLADVSKKGLRESLGLMVNYLYDPRSIEDNHEKFVHGEIVASRRVLALDRTD